MSPRPDATPDLIAVDGGNSKIDVALTTRDGRLLGAARGGGASFSPGDEGPSLEALVATVSQACAAAGLAPENRPAAPLGVLCLAGADLPADDRRLLRALRPLRLADEIVLRNDTFAVLRAGTERDWGVGVVCGTGMNCSAVAPNGRQVRYAALGDISGDDGGGGWLGRQAVRAAVRGHDGRDPHTALERDVPAWFGVATVPAVLELLQAGHAERTLAGLAPIVFRCASDGDGVARRLVDRQADEIVAMVESAVRRLHLTRRDVDVVLGGGLFHNDEAGFLARVECGIHIAAPKARIRPLEVPPVVGAVLLGLDRLGAAASAGDTVRAAITRDRLAKTRIDTLSETGTHVRTPARAQIPTPAPGD